MIFHSYLVFFASYISYSVLPLHCNLCFPIFLSSFFFMFFFKPLSSIVQKTFVYIHSIYNIIWTSLVIRMVKNLPAMQETWV